MEFDTITKKHFGVAGSALLFICVFTPILNAKVLALQVALFSLFFHFATIALIVTLTENYRWNWLPAIGTLGVLVWNESHEITAHIMPFSFENWGVIILVLALGSLMLSAGIEEDIVIDQNKAKKKKKPPFDMKFSK